MPEENIPVEHDWVASQWDWPFQHDDGVVKVINTDDKFEVGLQVQYFTPKEIEVKVMGDEIVIHCRHEQRSDDYGKVTREVHRTYKLPPDINRSTLKTYLNQKGVLVIAAKK